MIPKGQAVLSNYFPPKTNTNTNLFGSIPVPSNQFKSAITKTYALVTMVDVFEGDCYVVDLCHGEKEAESTSWRRFVIDTGSQSSKDNESRLKAINSAVTSKNSKLDPWTDNRGLPTLYAVIITHSDKDHSENASSLIDSLRNTTRSQLPSNYFQGPVRVFLSPMIQWSRSIGEGKTEKFFNVKEAIDGIYVENETLQLSVCRTFRTLDELCVQAGYGNNRAGYQLEYRFNLIKPASLPLVMEELIPAKKWKDRKARIMDERWGREVSDAVIDQHTHFGEKKWGTKNAYVIHKVTGPNHKDVHVLVEIRLQVIGAASDQRTFLSTFERSINGPWLRFIHHYENFGNRPDLVLDRGTRKLDRLNTVLEIPSITKQDSKIDEERTKNQADQIFDNSNLGKRLVGIHPADGNESDDKGTWGRPFSANYQAIGFKDDNRNTFLDDKPEKIEEETGETQANHIFYNPNLRRQSEITFGNGNADRNESDKGTGGGLFSANYQAIGFKDDNRNTFLDDKPEKIEEETGETQENHIFYNLGRQSITFGNDNTDGNDSDDKGTGGGLFSAEYQVVGFEDDNRNIFPDRKRGHYSRSFLGCAGQQYVRDFQHIALQSMSSSGEYNSRWSEYANRASIITSFVYDIDYRNLANKAVAQPRFWMLFTGDAYEMQEEETKERRLATSNNDFIKFSALQKLSGPPLTATNIELKPNGNLLNWLARFNGPLGKKVTVDVLKVPHHGSSKTTNAAFYMRVLAKVYLISGGTIHHHPTTDTMTTILRAITEEGDPSAPNKYLSKETEGKMDGINLGPIENRRRPHLIFMNFGVDRKSEPKSPGNSRSPSPTPGGFMNFGKKSEPERPGKSRGPSPTPGDFMKSGKKSEPERRGRSKSPSAIYRRPQSPTPEKEYVLDWLKNTCNLTKANRTKGYVNCRFFVQRKEHATSRLKFGEDNTGSLRVEWDVDWNEVRFDINPSLYDTASDPLAYPKPGTTPLWEQSVNRRILEH